jgi:hypothetical protein
MTPKQAITALCLECGLCCNGVLFRDVELQTGDDVDRLIDLGLPVKTTRRSNKIARKLPQPCSALCDNLRCRVYAQRPIRCREFECALLQKVVAGDVPAETALRRIHRAKARIRSIERSLMKLGDQRADLPLKKRFQMVQCHLENNGCDSGTAGVFADLSESYHALMVHLAAYFYTE